MVYQTSILIPYQTSILIPIVQASTPRQLRPLRRFLFFEGELRACSFAQSSSSCRVPLVSGASADHQLFQSDSMTILTGVDVICYAGIMVQRIMRVPLYTSLVVGTVVDASYHATTGSVDISMSIREPPKVFIKD